MRGGLVAARAGRLDEPGAGEALVVLIEGRWLVPAGKGSVALLGEPGHEGGPRWINRTIKQVAVKNRAIGVAVWARGEAHAAIVAVGVCDDDTAFEGVGDSVREGQAIRCGVVDALIGGNGLGQHCVADRLYGIGATRSHKCKQCVRRLLGQPGGEGVLVGG
jgi:hypothetical protein